MKLFEVLPPYLIQVNTNSKVIYTDVVDLFQDLNLNSGQSSTLITAKGSLTSEGILTLVLLSTKGAKFFT